MYICSLIIEFVGIKNPAASATLTSPHFQVVRWIYVGGRRLSRPSYEISAIEPKLRQSHCPKFKRRTPAIEPIVITWRMRPLQTLPQTLLRSIGSTSGEGNQHSKRNVRWSELENERLRVLYVGEKKSWTWTARKLGRTKAAVRVHWSLTSR